MRRLRSAGKQESILAAAAKVVVREGIWGATTRKIAHEASVNIATLHYHFDSKVDLLRALFESIIAAIRLIVKDDYPEPTPLYDRLEVTFLWSWAAMMKNLQEQVLQLELTLYSVRASEAAWLGREQYQAFVELYVDVLKGATEAQDHPALDLEGLSRFLISGLDGVLLQHLAEPDPERSMGMIRNLIYLARRFPLTSPADGDAPISALSLKSGLACVQS
jgi:AcrR family transcriptional regulator